MRVAILGSGSGGNSLIVESEGRRLMVDAGFSCRQIEQRLDILGEDPSQVEALLLTHEHQDHCRGVGRLSRKHGVPIYATRGTFEGAARLLNPRSRSRKAAPGSETPPTQSRPKADKRAPLDTRTIRSGEPFEVPGFRVESFQIPHDAREPVGFVIEDGQGARLGLVADLGARTQLAWGRLRDLDCLVIETNHDLQMLRTGPYPWHLKQRVASRHGHLSNREAAAGLPELIGDRLQTIVLYHLSQTNNLPALAEQAIGERLAAVGCGAEVVMTHQDEPTRWLDVSAEATAEKRSADQLQLW